MIAKNQHSKVVDWSSKSIRQKAITNLKREKKELEIYTFKCLF
jgi:hypothetical protein